MTISANIHPAEQLREPTQAHLPDPRSDAPEGQEAESLAAHHATVARFALHEGVPADVRVQFETARNLALYAWHVYRFYPVAEMQALSTLEFGLRERLPARLPPPYQSAKAFKPMLHGLLGYAIDKGPVRNEGFRRWHAACEQHARERQANARVAALLERGPDSLEFDADAPISIEDEDRAWDLVAHLRQSLPQRRNQRAHGGAELHRMALNTIELVAEILNQLYAACPMHEAVPNGERQRPY